MTIKPVNNYVIIKLDKAEEKEGTLYTAAALNSKYALPKRIGTVRAVGRGLVTADGTIIPPQVKPGDRVIIVDPVKVTIEVEFEGEKCNVLSDESHIIGIINAEPRRTEVLVFDMEGR